MLVVTRKVGESIVIDDHVTVTVVRVGETKVKLSIDAPPGTDVHRQEVYTLISAEPVGVLEPAA